MTTATPTRFLVIGAGELGQAMITALTGHIGAQHLDDTVTVLLRPPTDGRPQRLEGLTSAPVAVVHADIASASPSELAEIFDDYDTVISCLGFAAGAGTQRKLTSAVLASGVKRYLPWQFGADYDLIGRGSPQDLFDEQLDVRELLRAQHQTHWIIVSAGMFTSFAFEPDFGVVDTATRTVRALGSWDTELTLTTAEDIAKLTTAVLYTPPPIVDDVVYIAGDTITYRELADIVDRTLHTQVSRVELSVEQLHDELAADPTDTMKKYRAVFGEGVGVAWPKEQSFNARHNIPTTTAEQWARQHLTSPDRSA
ncbi:aromatic alcohol reductase [Mycobacterium bourgelatii]|uniref:2'-hydroxyisoflavone reductase n=1 Tax=Mycobacterium bourgelatii TaxID=1273442 RepID=A0A7I9YRZ0_MYCBU|nr:aromatic alcohol reductase [Mycobacterium bourgelatii]MCV6974216.1 aromatic alcohol reductase [Mycobacterium bourgelatii]GFG91327.1 2'-hydroxyisoflavone reductase [Mycobacterium bourgelatii]